jgi:hypothetical protein|tara:strand:+ start:277 stop:639 length:363 start_codon:yes stop_codon:yes gene_type:complete
MAAGIIKKTIQKVIKKLKKPGYKKYKPDSKNVGINKAEAEKLYKVVGEDQWGPIKMWKGKRMPLDKARYTERRPWLGPRSGHYERPTKKSQEMFSDYKITNKAEGGLIRGFPKLAKKGWK